MKLRRLEEASPASSRQAGEDLEISAFLQMVQELDRNSLRGNGFRILGLPTTSSERVISARRESLINSLAFELEIPRTWFMRYPEDIPVDERTILNAELRLADARQRIIDELFWFWSPVSDGLSEAEDASGSRATAPEGDIQTRHDLALLALQNDSVGGGRTATQLWSELLLDPQFWHILSERIREIEDPRLSDSSLSNLRKALTAFLIHRDFDRALHLWAAGSSSEASKVLFELRNGASEHPEFHQIAFDRATQIYQKIKGSCAWLGREDSPDLAAAIDGCNSFLTQQAANLEVLEILGEEAEFPAAARSEIAEAVNRRIARAIRYRSADLMPAVNILEKALLWSVGAEQRENIRQHLLTLRELREKSDPYCAPGYYASSPDVLLELENAYVLFSKEMYSAAIQRLFSFTTNEQPGVVQQHSHVLSRAFAHMLATKAFAERNDAVLKFNERIRTTQANLIAKFEARRASNQIDVTTWLAAQEADYRGPLFCMADGAPMTSFRVVDHSLPDGKPCKLLFCSSCSDTSPESVNEAMIQAASDCVDAMALDPDLVSAAEGVQRGQRDAVEHGLNHPSTPGEFVRKLRMAGLVRL